MKKFLTIVVVIAATIIVAIVFFKTFLREPFYESITYVPRSQFTMQVTSTAFENGGTIPDEFTCSNELTGNNFPLSISNPPVEAESFVVTMRAADLDGGFGSEYHGDHWTLWNIPATTTEIPAYAIPEIPVGRSMGGHLTYEAPCPEPDTGERRYVVDAYALDTSLSLEPGSSRSDVIRAIRGHVLDSATLTGIYGSNQ